MRCRRESKRTREAFEMHCIVHHSLAHRIKCKKKTKKDGNERQPEKHFDVECVWVYAVRGWSCLFPLLNADKLPAVESEHSIGINWCKKKKYIQNTLTHRTESADSAPRFYSFKCLERWKMLDDVSRLTAENFNQSRKKKLKENAFFLFSLLSSSPFRLQSALLSTSRLCQLFTVDHIAQIGNEIQGRVPTLPSDRNVNAGIK